MLITVTGRRTGRHYTTPVSYLRDGDELTVFSRRGRSWWRNVEGGAPVELRLRGERRQGLAEVASANEHETAAALQRFYQRVAGRELRRKTRRCARERR
jgi:deazaflavin-dependent oxidoreductase (nitroreductase family)